VTIYQTGASDRSGYAEVKKELQSVTDTETFRCVMCESECDKVAFGLYSATSNDCSLSGSIAVVVMKLN